MVQTMHGKLTTAEGIHIPYQWSYTTTEERKNATGFTESDIGKLARQLDDDSLWMLTGLEPSWQRVGKPQIADVRNNLLLCLHPAENIWQMEVAPGIQGNFAIASRGERGCIGAVAATAADRGSLIYDNRAWQGRRGLVLGDEVMNLVTNPSFALDTMNWNANNSTISRDTTKSCTGIASLKVECQATSYAGTYTTVSLEEGIQYTFAADIHATTAGHKLKLLVWDGGEVSVVPFETIVGWQRICNTFTSPHAGSYDLYVQTDNYSEGPTFNIDRVTCCKMCDRYLDGSMGEGFSWTGTAHASASLRRAAWIDLSDYTGLLSEMPQYTVISVVRSAYAHDAEFPHTKNYLWTLYNDATHKIALYYCTTTGWTLDINGNEVAGGGYFGSGDLLFVVVTFNFADDRHAVYVNGKECVLSTEAQEPPAASTWKVGSDENGMLQGEWSFYEYVVLDRVLSAQEIRGLYSENVLIQDVTQRYRAVAENVYLYDVDNARVYISTPTGVKYYTIS